MTRINCIPVSELSDEHLGAEYRELPRVFGLVLGAVARGERPDDPRNPTDYVLGPGHVRFFYPRLAYIVQRYVQLVRECRRRGRTVAYEGLPAAAEQIPGEWFGKWMPDDRALFINRARIMDRLYEQGVL